MGAVKFDGVESSVHSTRGGGAEVVDDLLDAVLVKGVDGQADVLLAVSRGGGRTDGNPAALLRGYHAAMESRPPLLGGGLPAGVTELHGDLATKLVDGISDGAPGSHLVVIPQPGVSRADAAFGADRGGLGDDEAEATSGKGPVMDEMPGARDPVVRIHRVLAHRW